MVRPSVSSSLLAVASAAVRRARRAGRGVCAHDAAGAQIRHVVVVDRMSDAAFAALARRGAVGLLRPSFGPTTSRRRALAELVRGDRGQRAASAGTPRASR